MRVEGCRFFSATPPTESVYSLMSAFMMKDKDNNEKKLMAPWDISRAPFMSKAQRDLYVEPPKDQQLPGDTEPMVGKLMRSMYGTQDASQIFQKD